MSKKSAKRVMYPTLLVAAWGLMAYSVLFGGFSTSLADYGGGGGAMWCPTNNNTCGDFGCHDRTELDHTQVCSRYPIVSGANCPSPVNCTTNP